eukprot:CAMPEP_0204566642 /NCGR_PEP_ID=MMETSP0661-20131031/36163_1 /ASSEMBLY_ACC=CAM_ASM_000606 /TAXON_ID=109239 /ORGANISM="Alexandrium margalefi, Strain AMGDE01CS-322" /LENGTH=32 /DNA_ID= /DNA_START= /DNA_END= /DNA_ORIENTATION=
MHEHVLVSLALGGRLITGKAHGATTQLALAHS